MTTKDFSPVVTRILRQNPDAIDIANNGASSTAFLGISNALHEQGYRKNFFGISVDLASLKGGQPGVTQMVVGMPTDLMSPAIGVKERELFQRFISAYKESEIEPATVANYLAAPLLAQAMEKAGTVTDTEKIVQVLAAGEWDTIFGKSRFGGVKTFGSPTILDQTVYLSKSEGDKLVTFDAMRVTLP